MYLPSSNNKVNVKELTISPTIIVANILLKFFI